MGVALHTFNPSTGEAEADQSLPVRPVWSREQIPGQPERLQRNPVSDHLTRQNKQTNPTISLFLLRFMRRVSLSRAYTSYLHTLDLI